MAQQSAKRTTANHETSAGFTAEERAAMKERAAELKAEARATKDKAAGERDLLTKIAELPDRIGPWASGCTRSSPPAHQSSRQDLVRDARVRQGRQGRLLLHAGAEVQHAVCDVRLQRHGESRRRHHVARRLRADGVDRHRRGRDCRAREASGELRPELAARARLGRDRHGRGHGGADRRVGAGWRPHRRPGGRSESAPLRATFATGAGGTRSSSGTPRVVLGQKLSIGQPKGSADARRAILDLMNDPVAQELVKARSTPALPVHEMARRGSSPSATPGMARCL